MLPVQKFVASCLLQGCVVGLTLFSGAAQNAIAADVTPCAAVQRPSLDARLTDAADRGPQAFHVFVTRTRMIYELDYPGALARVERHRQAQDACNAQIASAK